MKHLFLILAVSLALYSCGKKEPRRYKTPYIVVLGVAQDGGFPQIGCAKYQCTVAHEDPELARLVSSLGLVDPENKKKWIFDATPDIGDQIRLLNQEIRRQQEEAPIVDGVFLTHAHMGHYTGLMHLGHEALGAANIPVYAMPLMSEFLVANGPWSQLVDYKNINVEMISEGQPVDLGNGITVTSFLVPHREEFSETVGYKIQGKNKSVIFIPDINKWDIWNQDIVKVVEENDYVFIDGTFYENGEIPGRDMSEFPHPFIEESMSKFEMLSKEDKSKIYFTHFNHTNPAILEDSPARYAIEKAGFNVAKPLMRLPL